MAHSTEVPQESALLAGVVLPGVPMWEAEESLDELARLADTATLVVVDRVLQNRKRIDPTYYVGKGKAEELRELASSRDADGTVIFIPASTDVTSTEWAHLSLSLSRSPMISGA